MSRVYESLKKGMHDTLQRGKVTPINTPRLIETHSSLASAVEAVENLLVESISTLKATVTDAETTNAAEMNKAALSIEHLNGRVAALDAKITEMEDIAQKRDLATKTREEHLLSKIRQSDGDLQKRTETLKSRDIEIRNQKSKIESQTKRLAELEAVINQLKREAAAIEQIASEKDSALREVQETSAATIRGLEVDVTKKDNMVAEKDKRIVDLESQLKAMSSGIREMSSFFKQTAAFADLETTNSDAGLMSTKSMSADEKPTVAPSDKELPISSPQAVQQPLPLGFFKHLIDELTQSIGPMATFIISDHVSALGESSENFPKERATELLEVLSHEILDEAERDRFRKQLSKIL